MRRRRCAIYDEIMAVKGIDFVPNFWKTLGTHPPLLAEVWRSLNRAMQPGRLDGLTKEMIALAVSATNGCTYLHPLPYRSRAQARHG